MQTKRRRDLECPGGCGSTRRVGKLMCRNCWIDLPPSPRSELFKHWRAAEADLSDDRKWSLYQQSKRAALHALRTKRARA